MAKRKAMGRDPLGWIGAAETVATANDREREESPPAEPARRDEVGERPGGDGPKFLSYEVMTARLRSDQVDFLNALERRIMRSRDQKGERITKNSLLRAAVDLLETISLDLQEIASEEELRARVLAAAEAASRAPRGA